MRIRFRNDLKFGITGSNKKSGIRTNQTLVTGLESDSRVSTSVKIRRAAESQELTGYRSINYITQGLEFLAIFP